ncbi:hypothetical protein GCM10007874_52190 [Labrys miyagiensis]|uniref:Uncharacterized protein n=1 Tax=Labrys miyagiensis TaxID=346912 RepID=A0ABQ6CP98_9HYPH|nr:hypothetical protein [Labrys miyagiensis]GLS22202.1 hypothetical protein GCM10007874_52190 [Labrys miyagiensis]
MTLEIIGRRAFLTLCASLALGSCATSYAGVASLPVIRAVHVIGGGNLWLQTMPPFVQRSLIQQLGPRYQPGARGGATLTVQLTDISFPTASNAGFGSVDTLDGRITLASASGAVLQSFPLFSSTASIDAAAEVTGPTPRRYDWLASSYAHWVLTKLA